MLPVACVPPRGEAKRVRSSTVRTLPVRVCRRSRCVGGTKKEREEEKEGVRSGAATQTGPSSEKAAIDQPDRPKQVQPLRVGARALLTRD